MLKVTILVTMPQGLLSCQDVWYASDFDIRQFFELFEPRRSQSFAWRHGGTCVPSVFSFFVLFVVKKISNAEYHERSKNNASR